MTTTEQPVTTSTTKEPVTTTEEALTDSDDVQIIESKLLEDTKEMKDLFAFLSFRDNLQISYDKFRLDYGSNATKFSLAYKSFYAMKYSPEKQLLLSKIKASTGINATMDDLDYFLQNKILSWPDYTLNKISVDQMVTYLEHVNTVENKELERKQMDKIFRQYKLYSYISYLGGAPVHMENDLVYLYANSPFSLKTYEYEKLSIEVKNDYNYIKCGGPEKLMHHLPHSWEDDYFLLFLSRAETIYEIKGVENVVAVVTGKIRDGCVGPEVFILNHNMTITQATDLLKSLN